MPGMQRRAFLSASALSLGAFSLSRGQDAMPRSAMGVSAASCGIQLRASRDPGEHPKFADPVAFLEYCVGTLGAGGVQIGVRLWEASDLGKRLRARAEELGVYLEGQIGLPKDVGDVARFAQQMATAKEAGVQIFRTVMLGGRRYESFPTRASWEAFRKRSWNSLELAAKVVEAQGVQLAVENHKDWRVEELLRILEGLSSAFVGVNLDTGNNISLLEDPHAVVEALAPFSLTTHLKDMAVREYEEGFLLAEVPLGEGYLDLPRIIQTCRKANPDIRFNLEMITRDPLKIPCLTDRYWVTFDDDEVSAQELAARLRRARSLGEDTLQRVSHLALEERIRAEQANNERSFAWARAQGV